MTDRQTEHELTGYPSIDKPWLKWYEKNSVNSNHVNSTVWKNVYECNKQFIDDTALIFQNKKLTYRCLFFEVDRIANALVGNGLKSGDRIIVCSTGTPETVYILLACSKVGICAEMINLSLDEETIISSISESLAPYIFCLDKIYIRVMKLLKESGKKIVVIPATYSLSGFIQLILKATSKEKCDLKGTIGWEEFLRKQDNNYVDNEDPESALVIVYSSGSTGKPKAIIHSNRSYTAMSEQYRICEYPFKRNDKFLNQIPFFIASGLSFMLMAPLMQGITIILEPEYEPKKWVDDILKYKPNVICATKSFWDVTIKEKLFANKNLSFVNIAVQGGEPNTKKMEDEINTVLKECNCKQHVVVGYGMSEFNGTLSTSSLKYHKEGSAGIPLPGVVISSFDTMTGKECKNNERGEIMATSPCVMKGYLNDVALTEKLRWSDSEGRVWFRTGDIGYVDEQGEVYVLGRAIDAIKYSEKTIYMFDIEKMVQQLPGIVTCKVVSNSANKIYINIISQKKNDIELVKAIETKVLNDIGLAGIDFSVKIWEEFPINANGKCDREALMTE